MTWASRGDPGALAATSLAFVACAASPETGPGAGEDSVELTAVGSSGAETTTGELTTAAAATGDSSGGGSGGASMTAIVSDVWAFLAMDLGDVDGDGRLDLVTSGTGFPPRVTVYPGSGDGTFQRDPAVASELFEFTAFVLGDVTGDGRADLIAQGTGYPPRVTVYAGGDDLGLSALATTELVEFEQMHASDMDLDGHVDLLIGDGDANSPWAQVWPGGAAGIADGPLFEGHPWRYDHLRGGDVDGDGRPDLVTARTGSSPQLRLHPGDGAGGFGEAIVGELRTFARLDVGDVDADGRSDAVADVPGNPWRFQLYRAVPGGWSEPELLDGHTFIAFELGDVDGDGRADLVVQPTGDPPRVEVYLSP